MCDPLGRSEAISDPLHSMQRQDAGNSISIDGAWSRVCGRADHVEDQHDVPGQCQVDAEGRRVWVHAADGSTVGRFCKRWGMDVHTTATAQLNGAPQCLACTHGAPGAADWERFCALMEQHHGIIVDRALLSFG